MSFIDDIVDLGSTVLGGATSILKSDGIGGSLARTALLGLAVNQVSKMINSENSVGSTAKTSEPDRGVRLQVNPDSQHKIPVVYGSAHLGGIISDAVIANGNTTMYYCITICEMTGTKFSDGNPSTFEFNDIYWNDHRLVFKSDGITAAYMIDRESNVDYSVADLVKVYCYTGSSSSADQVAPFAYTLDTAVNAYSVVPGWTSNHAMNDLVFAIVRVDYSKEKNITSIPDIKFHITNSMTLPGDCIYDYATNTRYGAGINSSEIYSA